MSIFSKNRKFPFYHQPDSKDCGPTCLRMIAKFYGKHYNLQTIRNLSRINKSGVSLLGISEAAEKLGFRSLGARLTVDTLIKEAPFPCIAHWQNNHFVVIYKSTKEKVYVADPAKGLNQYSKKEFSKGWSATNINQKEEGLILLLEPTPLFHEQPEEIKSKVGFQLIFKYFFKYQKLIFQLVLGAISASLLQLAFPFLTKSIVDVGVAGKNINFIYLILTGQIMLLIGRTSVDLIRSWILLHISARINVSLVSDFFIKMMKLPLSYFDSKMTGDILQRVNDQRRIEQFMTGSTLSFFFSFLSFIVFSVVLLSYNVLIFFVFITSAILYGTWVLLFMKYRKKLDYKRFEVNAKNSDSIMQMIGGMQEIKLNNSERSKRWEWERLQARLFKINIKGLIVEQYQQVGAFFINEGKNIFITIISAKYVIEGRLSLGTMLAIQYIIGQLNSPIDQFVQFIKSFQDASISLERINEIHSQEDEEPTGKIVINELPSLKDITLENVSFRYPGAGNLPVLKNITLRIPFGKVTAIVGMSGSGKTTLLKLLLKFYRPESGQIKVGDMPLERISNYLWRDSCGVVMQDGFIFSDTIAHNIAVGKESVIIDRLLYSLKMSNINDFVNSLPLNYNTVIGADGTGVSMGQRQRILIARAIYTNPDFLFFDEATNALDATNEKVIMENLKDFYNGRTVVVIAHRLSTVREADQIVVLDKGSIVELGTHQELTEFKGRYFTLVKNQLELGN